MRGAAAAWLLTLAGCHLVFGVDGTDGGAGGSDAAAFCCVARTCGAATTPASCEAFGCTWSVAPTCVGDHPACSTNTDAATCGAHACTWDDAGPCGGVHSDCSVYSSAECGQHGCSIACKGTPTPCSEYRFAIDCEAAGCQMDIQLGGCTGSPTPCENRIDPGACGVASGCVASCEGTPHACSDHQDVFSCTSWGAGNSGCTWGTNACGGSPHTCASNTDATVCAQDTGCTWSDTGGCVVPDDCSARPATACGAGCEAVPCP